ncbi:hypothetical protein Fmac_015556 [Flemingia macrophylla]|uniref:Disease resistance protein RPS4B/Roq1-like leucine-rich repeats domain-containing protein n=1 Tax=Flemingia macrophylla TaxID=520843 RepID=A0ABD1MEW6_9FABA
MECSSLESLSPINLSSAVKLQLSGCSSLGSFPEITEKMNNLRRLYLYGLSIAELPWASFQNLCRLKRLHLTRCGAVQLPSRIFTELGLIIFKAEWCEGLHWPDLEVGEEPLTIEFLTISDCNLSDDFFDKGFQRFSRVKKLNLTGNNFTFLPKCINKLQLLKHLDVHDCYHLREIRGIPPQLKYLNAANCESLSCSSKSMVIKEQKRHELEGYFRFPGESVSDWFHQRSTGLPCSFWFRDKFPLGILCCTVVGQKNDDDYDYLYFIPEVFINGKLGKRFIEYEMSWTNLDHTYFHLLEALNSDNDHLKKGWNHAELLYYFEQRGKVRMKEVGIHVMMEGGSMTEDVRFSDPSRKRKLDDFI